MNTAGLRSREARPMARTDAESARSRDVRGSSPVERSDSGEVPSAARRRGRPGSGGFRSREAICVGRANAASATSRDVRGSSPVERSDSGEVPSAARRRGRPGSAGARRGFSLFEVVVSIGVILALATALGAFVRDVARSRERLDLAMMRQRAADAAMDSLERALATTVVEDAILGVGVRGSAERLEVVARGVPAWRLGNAMSRRRSLEDRERLSLSGGDPALGEAIIRRGEGPEAREGRLPATLRFRYHDGEAWRSAFDSVREGRLPVAIEVSLWWPRDGDATEDSREDFGLLEDARPDDSVEEDRSDDAFEAERRGAATSLDVAREELGGPMRDPDRVRVIAVPDAATMSAESEATFEFGRDREVER